MLRTDFTWVYSDVNERKISCLFFRHGVLLEDDLNVGVEVEIEADVRG